MKVKTRIQRLNWIPETNKPLNIIGFIYIPLGGNKGGLVRTCANLFATFLIGGIWHGAGWTFVFWGFLHGIALVIHRLWSLTKIKLPKILAWIITFNFVNFAWVFFRANSFEDALKVLKGMVGINGVEFEKIIISANLRLFIYLILAFVLVILFKNSLQILQNKHKIYHVFYFSLIFLLGILSMSASKYSEFIYFNF